jgi:hypothetical protein
MKGPAVKVLTVAVPILAICTIFAGNCGCEFDPALAGQIMRFEGVVRDIDIYTPMLTIEGEWRRRFLIVMGTIFMKGNFAITLADISIGDVVVIDYYKDEPGLPKALRITVTGHKAFFI